MKVQSLFILIIFSFIIQFSLKCQVIPDTSIFAVIAPDTFYAEVVTTKGKFTIEAIREWSPMGVDRLYQLIKSGFYTNNCIYRVQPEYVVQFGISSNTDANYFWDQRPIPDEQVVGHNLKGVIDGFEVIGAFDARYGFEPANHQDSVMIRGNEYWEEHFPGLDYILEFKVQSSKFKVERE